MHTQTPRLLKCSPDNEIGRRSSDKEEHQPIDAKCENVPEALHRMRPLGSQGNAPLRVIRHSYKFTRWQIWEQSCTVPTLMSDPATVFVSHKCALATWVFSEQWVLWVQ